MLPIWQNCWEDIAWHVLNAQENLATTIIPTKPFSSFPYFLIHPQKGLLSTLTIYPDCNLPDSTVYGKLFRKFIDSAFVCWVDGGLLALGDSFAALGPPKAVWSFPIDTYLGLELLYQFFIKTSYFLFMTLADSLKMALPIGDTSKAFSQFLSGCQSRYEYFNREKEHSLQQT